MLVAFSEAKLQEMADIGLILISNVKYYFRIGISTKNLSHRRNFSQIRPEIKNFEISKDTIADAKITSYLGSDVIF